MKGTPILFELKVEILALRKAIKTMMMKRFVLKVNNYH